jgi:hypothetical protein
VNPLVGDQISGNRNEDSFHRMKCGVNIIHYQYAITYNP